MLLQASQGPSSHSGFLFKNVLTESEMAHVKQSMKQDETLHYGLVLCNVYKRGIQKVEFSNGERRIVDFRPLLTSRLREQLLDHSKFVQFALTDWTLEWYNGVDFAPERLYELGVAACFAL